MQGIGTGPGSQKEKAVIPCIPCIPAKPSGSGQLDLEDVPLLHSLACAHVSLSASDRDEPANSRAARHLRPGQDIFPAGPGKTRKGA